MKKVRTTTCLKFYPLSAGIIFFLHLHAFWVFSRHAVLLAKNTAAKEKNTAVRRAARKKSTVFQRAVHNGIVRYNILNNDKYVYFK